MTIVIVFGKFKTLNQVCLRKKQDLFFLNDMNNIEILMVQFYFVLFKIVPIMIIIVFGKFWHQIE